MEPTIGQVREQIARLKELKPNVRRYSMFGDDNQAAIQIQIDALEEAIRYGDVDREVSLAAVDEQTYNARSDVLLWLNTGDLEGDGDLADQWRPLVRE